MGAIDTAVKVETGNLIQWFYEAYQEAEEEYGKSAYNGTISTTEMGKVIKVYDEDIDAVIETVLDRESPYRGYFEKWKTNFLDFGVVGYIVKEPAAISGEKRMAAVERIDSDSPPPLGKNQAAEEIRAYIALISAAC